MNSDEFTAIFNQAAASRTGYGWYTYKGVKSLAYLYKNPETEWIVSYKTPEQAIMDRVASAQMAIGSTLITMLYMVLGVAAAGIVAGVAASVFVGKRLEKPLNELVEVSSEVTNYNLSDDVLQQLTRIRSISTNINTLARHFQGFISRLKHLAKTLMDQVSALEHVSDSVTTSRRNKEKQRKNRNNNQEHTRGLSTLLRESQHLDNRGKQNI